MVLQIYGNINLYSNFMQFINTFVFAKPLYLQYVFFIEI